jgi:hypothetical protein
MPRPSFCFLFLICFRSDTKTPARGEGRVRSAESMSAGIFQFSAATMAEQVIVLPPVKQAVNVTDLIGVSSVFA